jgi:hypothetical protein
MSDQSMRRSTNGRSQVEQLHRIEFQANLDGFTLGQSRITVRGRRAIYGNHWDDLNMGHAQAVIFWEFCCTNGDPRHRTYDKTGQSCPMNFAILLGDVDE